jgi:predicted Zn-dependent protease
MVNSAIPHVRIHAFTEVLTALGLIRAGAAAAFTFIAKRWWLIALADLTISQLTGGKISFPRSLEEALGTGGAIALSKLSEWLEPRIGDSSFESAIMEALNHWQATLVLDAAQRRGDIHPGAQQQADIVAAPIPENESLPAWLTRMETATGLARSAILHLRAYVNG